MIFEAEPITLNRPRKEFLSSYDTSPEENLSNFVFSFQRQIANCPGIETKLDENLNLVFKSKNNGIVNMKNSNMAHLSDVFRTTQTDGLVSTYKTAYEEFEELRLQLCQENSLGDHKFFSTSSELCGFQREGDSLQLIKRISTGSSTDSDKSKLRDIIRRSADLKLEKRFSGNSMSTRISSLATELSRKREIQASEADCIDEDGPRDMTFKGPSLRNSLKQNSKKNETLFENDETLEILKAKGFYLNSDTLRNSLNNQQYEESLDSVVALFKKKENPAVQQDNSYLEKVRKENEMLKLTNVRNRKLIFF